MAFPLIPGSNPETETIDADSWTLVAQGVKASKVHNDYQGSERAYITYVTTGDPAPVGFNVPKWKIPESYAEFEDSITPRDIYVYPQNVPAKITVEA